LAAAGLQRHERQLAGKHKRANTRRPAELVRRKRHQIRTQPGVIERQLPGALHGIAVKKRARACATCAASATGWTIPVSLLASMSETSAGRCSAASMRSSASTSTIPRVVTG